MKILFLLFFLSLLNFSHSQEICLKLDSVECYRVPWHIKSNFNIHNNEIIYGESFSNWRVENTIIDKQALHYFVKTNFVDTSRILIYEASPDEIDARAVLILHYGNGLKDTLIFNGNTSYYYGQNVYVSNIKLLLWLIRYNPLEDPSSEFLNPKDVNKLCQRYNFMIE